MSETTVKPMDVGPGDDAPPPGTAIVRPLGHVRAVRQRYMLRFTDPAQAAASRSARAWAWALGETAIAPVTDQETDPPPSRSQIDVEIAIADGRRLRGERETRADGAAAVLRWLIGEDDHIPVRGDNPGELVGGFADVVRSSEQIAQYLGVAQAAARGRGQEAEPNRRRQFPQDPAYFQGVAATLAWALRDGAESPITHVQHVEFTTCVIKAERIHATDVLEQSTSPWIADRHPPRAYCQGVMDVIGWLLGDTTEL